jgi:hypothetical protein
MYHRIAIFHASQFWKVLLIKSNFTHPKFERYDWREVILGIPVFKGVAEEN